MKHLNKFNEAKNQRGSICGDCGEKIEMYYKPYCPKCDIQEIIKHKRGSYCLMPILRYGKSYVDGFDKDLVWDYLCENDMMKGNDTYFDYYVTDSGRENKMIKSVLDELSIDYTKDGGEVLFWVSW